MCLKNLYNLIKPKRRRNVVRLFSVVRGSADPVVRPAPSLFFAEPPPPLLFFSRNRLPSDFLRQPAVPLLRPDARPRPPPRRRPLPRRRPPPVVGRRSDVPTPTAARRRPPFRRPDADRRPDAPCRVAGNGLFGMMPDALLQNLMRLVEVDLSKNGFSVIHISPGVHSGERQKPT